MAIPCFYYRYMCWASCLTNSDVSASLLPTSFFISLEIFDILRDILECQQVEEKYFFFQMTLLYYYYACQVVQLWTIGVSFPFIFVCDIVALKQKKIILRFMAMLYTHRHYNKQSSKTVLGFLLPAYASLHCFCILFSIVSS